MSDPMMPQSLRFAVVIDDENCTANGFNLELCQIHKSR